MVSRYKAALSYNGRDLVVQIFMLVWFLQLNRCTRLLCSLIMLKGEQTELNWRESNSEEIGS